VSGLPLTDHSWKNCHCCLRRIRCWRSRHFSITALNEVVPECEYPQQYTSEDGESQLENPAGSRAGENSLWLKETAVNVGEGRTTQLSTGRSERWEEEALLPKWCQCWPERENVRQYHLPDMIHTVYVVAEKHSDVSTNAATVVSFCRSGGI
jgi:hypothetical protein